MMTLSEQRDCYRSSETVGQPVNVWSGKSRKPIERCLHRRLPLCWQWCVNWNVVDYFLCNSWLQHQYPGISSEQTNMPAPVFVSPMPAIITRETTGTVYNSHINDSFLDDDILYGTVMLSICVKKFELLAVVYSFRCTQSGWIRMKPINLHFRSFRQIYFVLET